MLRPPPRYTSTVTLFPYTTPFRSGVQYSPQLLDPPEVSDLTEEWYFFWALARRLGKSIEFGGVKLDTETAPVLEDLLRSRAQHPLARSEEHTSELQSLMRISYAVFCLKKKNTIN